MANRVNGAVLRLVVALAVALASLVPHASVSPSHDPVALAKAEAERHAQLRAEIAEHGHTHDDGKDYERSERHSHGHNPADHTHEIPSPPPDIASTLAALVGRVERTPPQTAVPDEVYRLERPPRPIIA